MDMVLTKFPNENSSKSSKIKYSSAKFAYWLTVSLLQAFFLWIDKLEHDTIE